MRRLILLLVYLIVFPLFASSQSIVGKWKITSFPSSTNGVPTYAEIEYKSDNTLNVRLVLSQDLQGQATLMFIYDLPGNYKYSGKALSQTFNSDGFKSQVKVEYTPGSNVSAEVKKKLSDYCKSLEPQVKKEGLTTVRVFSAGGMYKQILMLNYEQMIIGRPSSKPEVFERILTEEQLSKFRAEREHSRDEFIKSRQRQIEENKAAEEKQIEEEKAEAERIAAEAEAERVKLEQIAANELAEKERLAAEKAEVERQAAEKAAEEKRLATEKAEAERIVTEKAEEERIAVEKAARLAAEKAEAERIAEAERLAAERVAEEQLLAAEKAEADRLSAENTQEVQTSTQSNYSETSGASTMGSTIIRKGSKLLLADTGVTITAADLDTSQWSQYTKGSKLMKTGNAFYIASGITLVIFGVSQLGYSMYAPGDTIYEVSQAGLATGLFVTPACAITGLILRLCGKSKLNSIVTTKNNGLASSTISFGAQPNGIGLAYRF